MANVEKVKLLKQAISEVAELREKGVVRRPEWGAVNFENSVPDFDRGFSIAGLLDELPLDALTDATVDELTSLTGAFVNALREADGFTIGADNPSRLRDQIAARVRQASEGLFQVGAHWIPFLAYQKGDISENMDLLSSAVEGAAKLVADTRADLSAKSAELNGIVEAARTASSAAGAAVFTGEFESEATSQSNTARGWLLATGALGAATLFLAVTIFFTAVEGQDLGQVIQKSAARFASIGILLTATLWCGRIYKALQHQAAVNSHRAVSLKTLQAFSHAAADAQTKDAVLLEASRAVFGIGGTGYLDAASPAGGVQVVEIAKSITNGTQELQG